MKKKQFNLILGLCQIKIRIYGGDDLKKLIALGFSSPTQKDRVIQLRGRHQVTPAEGGGGGEEKNPNETIVTADNDFFLFGRSTCLFRKRNLASAAM
ncbi:hypothetical protein GWI33_013905 [Rhynchophorus ferrugineus]|uniref:Uncharacterized protein n=1 Tax=Rhynchophorus ferrugineus TaxID=354439 RepID=A0A834M9J4_RHYFE|nr:hypothetical protein GWI33_013905 [Rhynchophorus ferrugineus]